MQLRAKFEPKVSIVTGGGAGIGAAICRELADLGSHVVVADLDGASAERVASSLPSATAVTIDVTDTAALRELISSTAREHGRLDVMVNNAGVLFSGPFGETTDSHWAKAMDVNVMSVVHGTRAAYDIMRRQPGRGWILNTGSLAGLMPAPWSTPYTTSKQAVVGFSRAVRAETMRDKVVVSVLCPGYVDTALLDESFEPSASVAKGGFRANAKSLQPKLMTPEQVGEAAIKGLAKGKAVIPVGWFAGLMSRVDRFTPRLMDVSLRVEVTKLELKARRARKR